MNTLQSHNKVGTIFFPILQIEETESQKKLDSMLKAIPMNPGNVATAIQAYSALLNYSSSEQAHFKYQ